MNRWGMYLAILTFFLFKGCMIIPTPEHGGFPTRGRIEKKELDLIISGKTTREEVLLHFGEPDVVMRNERVFAYHWIMTAGYFVVGGYYSANGGSIGRRHLVLLEFENNGIVKRYEVKEGVFLSLDEIYKW